MEEDNNRRLGDEKFHAVKVVRKCCFVLCLLTFHRVDKNGTNTLLERKLKHFELAALMGKFKLKAVVGQDKLDRVNVRLIALYDMIKSGDYAYVLSEGTESDSHDLLGGLKELLRALDEVNLCQRFVLFN